MLTESIRCVKATRRGFAKIELLAVIAIIALMGQLMPPVLQNARRVACSKQFEFPQMANILQGVRPGGP